MSDHGMTPGNDNQPEDPMTEQPLGDREDRMRHLEDAVDAFLDFDEAESSSDDFLANNEHVRDLLEPMLAPPSALTPPASGATEQESLGDFRILKEVGRGGMGVVYEAWQVPLARSVALKVLPAHLTLQPKTVARFRREAQTAGGLDHAGIVKVLAVGEHEGTHFFAMELIEGAPLSRILDRLQGKDPSHLSGQAVVEQIADEDVNAEAPREATPLPSIFASGYVQAMVCITLQVADALHYAHQRGVVHRDIKPSNILIRHDGQALLSDFGLAFEEGLPGLTMTGELAGTPFYISPEQAMAKRMSVDRRTDIFSLGATLYEMLTLVRPFDGSTNQEVMGKIITKEPRDPVRLNPSLLPDLCAIVIKALEKDPDRRYQTAGELATDLRAFLDYRPVSARRVSPAGRLGRFCKREPLKAGFIGVCLAALVCVAAFGFYIWAKSDEIEAGETAMREKRVDRNLARGYLGFFQGDNHESLQAFEEALIDAPKDPAARAGLVLALLRIGRRDDAKQALQDTNPTIRPRIRVAWLHAGGKDRQAIEENKTLPPADEPWELYLQGLNEFILSQRTRPPALRTHAERSYRLTLQAVLRSEQPRFHHVAQLLIACTHLEDRQRTQEHIAALRKRYPNEWFTEMTTGLAFVKSDPPAAERALRRALKIRPDLTYAYSHLALSLARQKRFAEAETAFRRRLTAHPKDQSAHSNLAVVLREQGKLEQARTTLKTLLAFAPKHGFALAELARLETQAGRLDQAIATAGKALDVDPTNLTALHALGKSLGAQGQAPASKSNVLAQRLRKAAQHAQTDAPLLNDIGAKMYEHGMADEARQAFARCLHLNPANIEALLNAAACHIDNHAWEQARQSLGSVLRIDPKNARAYGALGVYHMVRNELDLAAVAYRKAIALDAQLVLAHKGLAKALIQDGRQDQALSVLRRASKALPNEMGFRLQLAQHLLRAKQYTEAAKLLHQVVAKEPTNTTAQISLGTAEFALDHPKRALRAFDAAWASNDKNVCDSFNLNFGRGRCQLAIGNAAQAVTSLQTACRVAHSPSQHQAAKNWLERAKRARAATRKEELKDQR